MGILVKEKPETTMLAKGTLAEVIKEMAKPSYQLFH